VAQVERVRQRLDQAEAQAAVTALFADGLRFKFGNGLWLIEGAASCPTYRTRSVIRLPLARGGGGCAAYPSGIA
jgi:hypothetical protein